MKMPFRRVKVGNRGCVPGKRQQMFRGTALERSPVLAKEACQMSEEELSRDSIYPAVCAAYRDGKAGVLGYPLDPEAEIAEYETEHGPMSNRGKQLCTVFVRCLNAAYAQGREL